jgi:hypothetical protein
MRSNTVVENWPALFYGPFYNGLMLDRKKTFIQRHKLDKRAELALSYMRNVYTGLGLYKGSLNIMQNCVIDSFDVLKNNRLRAVAHIFVLTIC